MEAYHEMSAGAADTQKFADISNEEKKSLKKYGFPFASEAFRPHFTLGRSDNTDGKEPEFAKTLEKEMPYPKTIMFDRLVIFNVGTYGSLESVRKEFTLE